MARPRTYVTLEEPILMVVGFSEAATAYGIAGEYHWCKLTGHYDGEGSIVSVMAKVAHGPENWAGIFTPGELGFYTDESGDRYCYPDGL